MSDPTYGALYQERDDLRDILAALLSAVTTADGSSCTSDPCPTCTASEIAQSMLNDMHPERRTGWWLIEDQADIVAAAEAVRPSGNAASTSQGSVPNPENGPADFKPAGGMQTGGEGR